MLIGACNPTVCPFTSSGYQLAQAVGFLFVGFFVATLAGTGLNRRRRRKAIAAAGDDADIQDTAPLIASASTSRPPPPPYPAVLVAMRFGVGFVLVFIVVLLSAVDPVLGAALAVFPGLGTANQVHLTHHPCDPTPTPSRKCLFIGGLQQGCINDRAGRLPTWTGQCSML